MVKDIQESTNLDTLLIVDDSEADRELFKLTLLESESTRDYKFVEAESCEEALEILKTLIPVCCLVDYRLPNDNGLDFLKAIRRLEYGDDIPVIIMTGEGDEKIAVEMMRNGAQDYLVKGDISQSIISRSIANAIHTCELQSKLRHLAHYDNLTGLLNRSLFQDRLQATIGQCDRYNQSCSLLYIDVDNFKQINDQYGHEAGDFVLKAVSERIKQSCRSTDSAARLGGDEFAILLSHIDKNNTTLTAEKILKKVSEPIILDSQSIQVSLSIGSAHYPETASNLTELVSQSDEAMYLAKQTGKARYFQFTKEQRSNFERRSQLEKILPQAIFNDELYLVFQPIIDLKQDRLHSFEVLVRWEPEGYTVQASEIIELIARLSLFDSYHTWMIDKALKQLRTWLDTDDSLNLSLNLPADYAQSNLVIECLRKGMKNYGIRPEQLELEITETTLMKHPALSAQLLTSMREEGVRVAINDFGVGYSSMSYLASLPLNTLKIDRQYFVNAEDDIRNRKVIEAITALGHSLGLKVVAAGVETLSQYQMVKAIGCDYVQGYYFGKPETQACFEQKGFKIERIAG